MKSILRALVLASLSLSDPAFAAVSQFWVYKATNLLVPEQVAAVKDVIKQSAACGATHLLLTDTKFGRLGEMEPRYFKNVEEVKQSAKDNGIEIIPCVCPIGYSDALLISDPNLIEALPVKDVPMVVSGGLAKLEADPGLKLKAGDMSDLKSWGWKDENVVSQDGAAYVKDPGGKNARLTQKVTLKPWREYHLSVRVKTNGFKGTPEVKFLDKDGRALNYDYLMVAKTQDWKVHHVVFNSQDETSATLFLGCWDGSSGELWWDDATLEETTFMNLVRRDGAPLKITTADGKPLAEGKDFEKLIDPLMGTKPYNGCYTVWHEPPVLKTSLPEGTKLRASWHHAVTVNDGQAGICPSEKRTVELMQDQIERVNNLFQPKAFMMSHDEIRVWNQCAACRARNLTAGQMLAENAKTCGSLIRKTNQTARIYVWSDMFDPNHNAKDHFYLARGDFAGSWEGLDKEVSIVPWYFEKRNESMKFFAERGHKQVMAGYYDDGAHLEKVTEWMKAAEPYPGVEAVMYTTWTNNYKDMPAFFKLAGAKPR